MASSRKRTEANGPDVRIMIGFDWLSQSREIRVPFVGIWLS